MGNCGYKCLYGLINNLTVIARQGGAHRAGLPERRTRPSSKDFQEAEEERKCECDRRYDQHTKRTRGAVLTKKVSPLPLENGSCTILTYERCLEGLETMLAYYGWEDERSTR
jgi:hypothetical protein